LSISGRFVQSVYSKVSLGGQQHLEMAESALGELSCLASTVGCRDAAAGADTNPSYILFLTVRVYK